VPTPPGPPYELLLDDKQWEQLQALPHESQRKRATAFLTGHASNTPTKRLPNGDLKQLVGEYKGYWQYDIGRKYRLIYRVDEAQKQVLVEYIGTHPRWGRGSNRKRRISS
jgi:addiction module RelE/StbE family toxin